MSIWQTLTCAWPPSAGAAEQRIRALEQELDGAREQAHQAWQLLDMLTQERVFICDMSPASATDQGNKLSYLNKLGKTTLAQWAPEIKQAFGVDATTLQGASIHTFHKNPERIRHILQNMKPGESRHNADIPIGSHILRSVSHALTNRKGEVVGIAATWIDVTDQVRYQNLIRQEITQVATAMEEMTATVKEIAASAHQASSQSTAAADRVKGGEHVVGHLVTDMNALQASIGETAQVVQALEAASSEISQIVEMIDDIADQTNLLALNAAIEAARAGDQGRGFAVVADEVRKLAERTIKATKEISTTIAGNREKTARAVQAIHAGMEGMDRGMTQVRAVSSALHEITAATQQMLDVTHRIASATEQQSATVTDVARSVNLIRDGQAEEAAVALATRHRLSGHADARARQGRAGCPMGATGA